jgi:adenosine 3'-phospho 5'-phosphosulfate transporter B3
MGTGQKLRIAGIPLSDLPRSLQFIVCCYGTFLFYLLYGYIQEWIFTVEGLKPHGWFLTFLQFGFYLLFGCIESLFQTDRQRKIPLKSYLLLAGLTVTTMGLSNASLGYLNYPTQVQYMYRCMYK